MYQTETFRMQHPKHGLCIADETAEAGLVALGWSRGGSEEQTEGGENDPPAGGDVPPVPPTPPAAQGAKAGATKSPAAQGAKA